MQDVNVKQIWSALDQNRVRVEFQIDRIGDGVGEKRAFGRILSNKRAISFPVSALAKGMRGARLIQHADGHRPYNPVVANVPSEDKVLYIYRNLDHINSSPRQLEMPLAIIGQSVSGKIGK